MLEANTLSHLNTTTDFKEGLSLERLRESRHLTHQNVRSERFKSKVAVHRRRRAPQLPVAIEPRPMDKAIVTPSISTEQMPNACEINNVLNAFAEDPENFDMQTLGFHLQAASLMAEGSDQQKSSLMTHGFIFNMGNIGLKMNARLDAKESMIYAAEAILKLLTTPDAHNAGLNQNFMCWLIILLYNDDLTLKKLGATIIGTLAHENTPLAHKLLQTTEYISGLVHILDRPTNGQKDPETGLETYQPDLALAVVSSLRMVLVASNKTWCEAVSSSTQTLGMTAMNHLIQLWSFDKAYIRHKELIETMLNVLDAAFKHGHETTKRLTDAIPNLDLLVDILGTKVYCFAIRGNAILLPAFSIFANVTSLEDPEYVDKVIASGFLEFCSTFLDTKVADQARVRHRYRSLEREVFLCMANIAAGTSQQVHTLLHSNTNFCKKLVERAAFDPKRNSSSFETALWVIVNSMTQGSDDDLLLFVQEGALVPVIDYILKGGGHRMYADKQLAKVSLQAIECALKLFPRLEGAGVERFVENDLTNKIESIVGYGNEILEESATQVQTLLALLNTEPVIPAEKIVKRLF